MAKDMLFIMFTSCYFSDANVSYFVAATVPHVEFLECLTREQFFRFFYDIYYPHFS
jgi:hypothetical protein